MRKPLGRGPIREKVQSFFLFLKGETDGILPSTVQHIRLLTSEVCREAEIPSTTLSPQP